MSYQSDEHMIKFLILYVDLYALVHSEYTLELVKENRDPCMLLVIDHYQ